MEKGKKKEKEKKKEEKGAGKRVGREHREDQGRERRCVVD